MLTINWASVHFHWSQITTNTILTKFEILWEWPKYNTVTQSKQMLLEKGHWELLETGLPPTFNLWITQYRKSQQRAVQQKWGGMPVTTVCAMVKGVLHSEEAGWSHYPDTPRGWKLKGQVSKPKTQPSSGVNTCRVSRTERLSHRIQAACG